jgi:exodeoxyribonuclease X
MRYWVVDSESTGVGPQDKAVEVAGFLFEDDRFVRYHTSLVNPGIPIPPEASSIHHLTDEDVADAPTIDEAMAPFFDDEFEFVVAHNAAFDKRMMDFAQCPWVCSLKLSRIVYPDAPNHKNQFLRYYLKLPKLVHSYSAQAAAHRALYDSEVTTYLFQHLLTKAVSDDPIQRMIHVSNNPQLLKICRLKKHEGKLWSEVPRDYLNWILNPRTPHPSPFDEDIIYTARHYYENR